MLLASVLGASAQSLIEPGHESAARAAFERVPHAGRHSSQATRGKSQRLEHLSPGYSRWAASCLLLSAEVATEFTLGKAAAGNSQVWSGGLAGKRWAPSGHGQEWPPYNFRRKSASGKLCGINQSWLPPASPLHVSVLRLESAAKSRRRARSPALHRLATIPQHGADRNLDIGGTDHSVGIQVVRSLHQAEKLVNQ